MGVTIFYLGCNHIRKNKNKYAGLVDYLVLDEKSLLLLGGMLKPSVRYSGLVAAVARQAHNLKVTGSNPTTDMVPRSPR